VDRRFVVCGEVEDRQLAFGRAFHRHLVRLQQNVMLFRFRNDGVAEIVIGTGRRQADTRGALDGEVAQILLQQAIGKFARSNLPARGDGQRKDDESEDECKFFHALNP